MSLRTAYDNYLTQWTHWQKTNEQFPGEGFWLAYNELVQAASMPENLQPYQHTFAAQLIREWIAFIPSLEDGSMLIPSHALNDALRRLMDAKDEIKAETETPEELADQGVRDDQIARMMGWDAQRMRQFRVAYSLARKGKPHIEEHLKKDGPTPEEKGRVQAAAQAKADYLHACRELSRFAESRLAAIATDEPAIDDWTPPPESILELHAQGVSTDQISRMWRKTPAEVSAIINGGSANTTLAEPTPDQIEAEIKALAETDPDVDHATIAEMLGVDEAIVAEVLG